MTKKKQKQFTPYMKITPLNHLLSPIRSVWWCVSAVALKVLSRNPKSFLRGFQVILAKKQNDLFSHIFFQYVTQ